MAKLVEIYRKKRERYIISLILKAFEIFVKLLNTQYQNTIIKNRLNAKIYLFSLPDAGHENERVEGVSKLPKISNNNSQTLMNQWNFGPWCIIMYKHIDMTNLIMNARVINDKPCMNDEIYILIQE